MIHEIVKELYSSKSKQKKLFSYLKMWEKIMFYVLIILSITVGTIMMIYQTGWLLFVFYPILIFIAYYYSNRLEKMKINDFYATDILYGNKLNELKNILEKRKLFSEKQLKHLISQIDKILPSYKASSEIFRPISNINLLILIPILIVLINWFLDNMSDGYLIVILLITFYIIAFALAMMFKPILEDVLDKEYKKYNKVSRLLDDLLLIHFYGNINEEE